MLLAGLCLPAAAIAAEPPQPLQRLQRFKLANGLEVIVAEDHRLPQVAMNLWLHAGPRDEGPQQTGFAYLVEHLMQAGSRHIPRGEAERLIDAAGGSDLGGSTNFDRSSYSLTLPTHQLELGLWLQADMLGWMIDGVDAGTLAAHKATIREQRRQNAEQRPYGIVDEAVYAALFPPGHPYRAAVIGSHADIQAIRLPDLQAFARSHVRPNNASLVLAGDVSLPRARLLVQRYFGSLQAGPPVPAAPAVQVAQPVIRGERRVVIHDDVALPRVTMAWHTPAVFQPGDAELDLAAGVLGGGRSGRLFKALIQDQPLAQSIDVSQYSLSLGSVFTIEVVARPGRTLAEIEAALDAELEALASSAPSAAELQRAQAGSETRLVQRLEKLSGLAEQLNLYQRFAGSANSLARDLGRYHSSTPESVRAAVAAHLRPSARVVVQGVPGPQALAPPVPVPDPAEGAAISLNAPEPWRKLPPPPGAPVAIQLPDGKRQQLPNGLTVVHVPRSGLPLVSATLVVRAGLDRNPAERPGLASFTAAMLNQGSSERSAADLVDAVAQLGASLAVDFGAEDVRITIAAMAARLPAALALVADMVLRPTFPAEALARLKQQRTAALERQRSNPASIADSLARAAFFGPAHPLGQSSLGDEDAIAQSTRNEMLAFWRAAYRPDEAALVVSGDVDQASLLRLAQSSFGAWRAPPGNTPEWHPPAPQPATSARVVLVDQPDAAQTTLQWIGPGPQADALDAAAAVVLSNALTGLGAQSALSLGRSQTSWVLRSSLRGDATAAGLSGALQQTLRLRAAPLPAEDLLRARDASLLALPGEFDTNDAITLRLARAWSLNLPADHHAQWPRRLAAVGAGDVQAVARRLLDPDGMRLVAVGDLQRLLLAVNSLGLGPVEVRDARGALLLPTLLPTSRPSLPQ